MVSAKASSLNKAALEKTLKDLENKLKEIKSILPEVGETFTNSARQILSTEVAKSDYPGKVITHRLEKSIVAIVDDNKMEVSIGPDGSAKNKNGQPYDYWVEEGHFMTGWGKSKEGSRGQLSFGFISSSGKVARWWEGHHYMRRAYEENKSKISKIVEAKLKKI